MNRMNFTVLMTLLLGAVSAHDALAYGVSHHGGPLLSCEPPQFFDESPAKDAKVSSFQSFSITASDNTDRDTVKVSVNNEPVPVTITEERSGRLAIQGSLKEVVTSGRVWIRVTGYSKDGCDQLRVWNVYVGQ